MTPRIGSLFSGYGGLDLAVEEVLGGETVWHCEVELAPSKILAARWPGVPNLGDVTAVDWANVEPVDVICGGSPCQDVSAAGKRAGMRAGTRSGLWASMCDAIDIIRPRLVVWENVRGVLSAEADSALEPCPGCVGDGDDGAVLRALGRVLGDLADIGYDASWYGLRAADVGAPHGRFRVFVVAVDSASARPQGQASGRVQHGMPSAGRGRPVADTERGGRDGRSHEPERGQKRRTAAPRGGANPAANAEGNEQREPVVRLGERSELGRSSDGIAWGAYQPAVRRWEARLGRLAPAPTDLAPKGGQRLSPRFVEWMMGLPAGWVTDVPGISRNDQLKALGNGVVPQQAAAALRHLLAISSLAA